MIFLQSVAVLTTLIGALSMVYKKRIGWLVFLVGNIAWISIFIKTELYLLVLTQLIFVVVNTKGWFQWGKKKYGGK